MFIAIKFVYAYIMGESANKHNTLKSVWAVCIMNHNVFPTHNVFQFQSTSGSLSYRNNTKE